MKKFKLLYLFTVLLFIIILIGVIFTCSRKNENRIVGSFQTPDTMDETRYLVFTDHQKYTFYRQFKILERGTYEAEDARYPRVYTLRNSQKKVTGNAILYGKQLYYIPKNSGTVFEMQKFSNVPDYVNVRENEGSSR